MISRLVQLSLFPGVIAGGMAGGLALWRADPWSPCSDAAAWEAVKASVRAQLVMPGAARFPELGDVRVRAVGPCAWRITAWVDAPNFNGDYLQADFVAEIRSGRQGSPQVTLGAIETRAQGSALPLPGADIGADLVPARQR
jgi:hypothetical protein